jgi:hypothetical protein
MLLRHIAWSLAAVLVALTFGVPFFGWLAARVFLQADMLVRIMASGGVVRRDALVDYPSPQYDDLVGTMRRRGVLAMRDEVLFLNPSKIGRILAVFIKIRLSRAKN